MKIHNLLKNPTDLPSKIEGGLHGESNDVYVLYRVVDNSTHNVWKFVLGVGIGFYSYDENLWYGYYDDHKCRISDFFDEYGGQRFDSVENLIELGCPEEFIQNMTKVPAGFAYDDTIEDGLVFTTEIIGWYELPTYEEFIIYGGIDMNDENEEELDELADTETCKKSDEFNSCLDAILSLLDGENQLKIIYRKGLIWAFKVGYHKAMNKKNNKS